MFFFSKALPSNMFLTFCLRKKNTNETCVTDNPTHADRSAPHRLNTHSVFPLKVECWKAKKNVQYGKKKKKE